LIVFYRKELFREFFFLSSAKKLPGKNMASVIRKIISKKITKAIKDFSLIEEGDRILVAVSGGKDSTALLKELVNRCGRVGPRYEVEAIHIQSDFANPEPRQFLKLLEQDVHIPFHYLDVNIKGRLKKGRKLNCYWCATQRRIELLQFACDNKFNKIALGHHLDDIIETLLMNMVYNGKFDGMPPRVIYEKYPVSLIRPLCYCEESELNEYIQDAGLARYTCSCEFSTHSNRKDIHKEIESLTHGSSKLKRNLFESMRNIQKDTLL